jgi:tripartite-type tricarboxylate transporter receptor subunit TctC
LLGAKALASSAVDGSSIGFLHAGLVSVQAMGAKIDLLSEFRPVVGRYNESQFVVAVHAESKHKTMADLMKDIAANPGKLNYGTGGLGTPAHVAFESLRAKVGNLHAQDVPFKGAVEGVNALIAKDLDFMLGVLSTVQVQVKTGRLRALAVTGATRSPQLPDVPTVAESGVPGFSHVSWSGFFGPAKMPDRLVTNLQTVFSKMAKETEYLQFIAANGGQIPPAETTADFQAFLRDSIARETAFMAKLGLKSG